MRYQLRHVRTAPRNSGTFALLGLVVPVFRGAEGTLLHTPRQDQIGVPVKPLRAPDLGFSGQVVGDEVGQGLVDVDPEVLVAGYDYVVGAVQEVGQFLSGRFEHGVAGGGAEFDHDHFGVVRGRPYADVAVARVGDEAVSEEVAGVDPLD